MVEKIIVNPEEIRGLGNIVSPHSIEDYELYNSTLEEGTATIGGVETVVYDMEMVTSDISITLTVSSASVTLGATVTLTATVLEDETPVSGEDVTFKVGTTTLGTGTTNSSGVATYSYTADTVGTLGLTASYGHVTSTSVSLVVNKHTPTMVCTASPTTVIINNTIDVSLLMTDENDDPVANTSVIFYTYTSSGTGASVARRTDSDGVVEYTYTANNTSIVAVGYVFVGDDSYVAAESNRVNITVLNHSYSLAFSQSSYPASGGSATLELTLLDNSVPVSGATVSVTGSDSSSYSCITNSSGIGSVTVTGVTANTTFTASYSNVSDSCTVTVGPSYLFYDDCSSDRSSEYGIVSVNTYKTPTITYNSTGYYTVKTGSTGGNHGFYIGNLSNIENCKMSMKIYRVTTSGNRQIGLALLDPSNSYHLIGRFESSNNSMNAYVQKSSSSVFINVSQSISNTTWYTLELTKSGNDYTLKCYDSSGTVLNTGNGTNTTFNNVSTLKPFIFLAWDSNKEFRIKDIKVEAL